MTEKVESAEGWTVGDIVKQPGKHGIGYRIHEVLVENGAVVALTTFGGPVRQWKTFRPDAVRQATKAEHRAWERVQEGEAALRAAIKPKGAVRRAK